MKIMNENLNQLPKKFFIMDSLEKEHELNLRFDKSIKKLKTIYPDLYYISLNNHEIVTSGVDFSPISYLFGIKKYNNYEKYINKACIFDFKKEDIIIPKVIAVGKLMQIDHSKNKFVIESLEKKEEQIFDLDQLNFLCPVFMIRNFDDFVDE